MKEQLNRVGWISDVVAVDPIELLVIAGNLLDEGRRVLP